MDELASRLRAVPEGDLSLTVGAVALGIAVAVAFERMEGLWAKFPLLLLLAAPCALLFLLALSAGSGGGSTDANPNGRLAAWQTACLLIALLLLAASLIQFALLVGDDQTGSGTDTWVFALTGICALAISARLQSPGATLLAALFLGIAALTAISWLDSGASISIYRDTLLLEGLLFAAIARMIWNPRLADAKLLVALGGVGLIVGAVLGNQGNPFAQLSLSDDGLIPVHSKDGWVLVLVVVTIGLLAFAAWQRHGPSAFVGLIGLAAFFTFSRGGDLAGWPLVLGLLTVGCFAWALIVRPGRPGGVDSTPAMPPPPAPQPPST